MNRPLCVLIVEDSEDDALLLRRELDRFGYDVTWERVERPEAMSAALDRATWDLILADYSMPNFRGDEALAMVRARELDIPFIFVSGTIGEEAAVAAMRVGANDYIMKGNLKRLVPAIERELQEVDVRRKQKQSEQDLKESDARYRDLVENATCGIYCSLMEDRFVEANTALAQILGYTSKQEILSLELPRDVYRRREHHDRIVREAQKSRTFRGIEVEWKRRDGRPIVVRLSGRTLLKAGSERQHVEVIAEDVTEQRALEKQVATLQKFDAIGRLAGGIAHDFNNVIGAILGWADLGVEEVREDPGPKRYFERIRDNSRLAADLTRQLLAFSRKQPIDPVPVDLNHTVSKLVELLGRTIGPSIKITTCLEPSLSSVTADPTQVQQVLMNLCLNARDAMPAGGELILETASVEVDDEYTRAFPYAKPGSYALLTVSDTGMGMDPVTLESIFEPFFTTKDPGKGTGLGLATVYGSVKQHGGFVHVYSEPGCGTSFRVYWPRAGVPAKSSRPLAEPLSLAGSETLLLAEDHAGMRLFTQEVLEHFGYTVIVAKDGKEALQLFKENAARVALLVLDVTMPILTGPEAYRDIVKMCPDVRVLFMTGYSREMTLLRDLSQEGLTVIQKPFTQRDLGLRVRSLLEQSKKNKGIAQAG